jgi:hypothetical protein
MLEKLSPESTGRGRPTGDVQRCDITAQAPILSSDTANRAHFTSAHLFMGLKGYGSQSWARDGLFARKELCLALA